MNKYNYKWVVYLIGIIILLTITVQLYWNYREYQINKQNLISKVQLSLDNAVEEYYAHLTKSGIATFSSLDPISLEKKTDTILIQTNSRRGFRKKIDSALQNIIIIENQKPVLLRNSKKSPYPFYGRNRTFPKSLDSLIHKVFISISRDSLNLKKLDSYLTDEFERNKIDVTYALKYRYTKRNFRSDSTKSKTISYKLENFPEEHLKTVSKSTFLPSRSNLELFFTDETAILLRDSFISILLSFLLSLSIIASLLYLLRTIYKQKQLAEVKNDFINNITHEFKTPIATISTVLEAMKNFNVLDDKSKTENYISMADSQVNKLNVMVEKILETAILNQEELALTKTPIDISIMIDKLIDKYKIINQDKTFSFNTMIGQTLLNLDEFHFQNALGNILDNATKYGGKLITVELTSTKNNIIISIKDNGNGIDKTQKDKVFEQFYRVSSGDVHTVKGFGIGLYYTKNIIEKHGGTINIAYDKDNNTLFKILMPNG